MKGFSMPSNMVVALILLILVLVVVGAFFLSQSGTQVTQTNAVQVFDRLCNSYKQENCAWSLTKKSSFNDFMQACKLVYGDSYEEFSCLYRFCCGTAGELTCEAKCNICSGNKKIGLDVKECCEDYSNECSDICEACVI